MPGEYEFQSDADWLQRKYYNRFEEPYVLNYRGKPFYCYEIIDDSFYIEPDCYRTFFVDMEDDVDPRHYD